MQNIFYKPLWWVLVSIQTYHGRKFRLDFQGVTENSKQQKTCKECPATIDFAYTPMNVALIRKLAAVCGFNFKSTIKYCQFCQHLVYAKTENQSLNLTLNSR